MCLETQVSGVSTLEITTIVVSGLTLVVATVALIVTIRQFRQQLRLNFFADYTKRYQEIILNLPEQINETDCKIAELDEASRTKTLRYMRAYFDLCSEEYFLHQHGNLDDKTWSEWKKGIEFAFSTASFKEAWATLKMDTIYYEDFGQFAKNAIEGEVNT